MTIKILKGKQSKPARTLIYGQPTLGKTEFMACAPKCIMICAEKGADLMDVDKIEVSDWTETLAAIEHVTKNHAGYETLAIDTLDAVERFATEEILRVTGAKSASDKQFEMGGWRRVLSQHWRIFTAGLDRAWSSGLNIFLSAHVTMVHLSDPLVGSYDKLGPKLDKATWGPIHEWVDDCLYVAFDQGVQKSKNMMDKTYAVNTGERVMYTSPHGGFEAKNRHHLPPTMPFERHTAFPAYWEYVLKARRNAEHIIGDILELLKLVTDPEVSKRVMAAIEQNSTNATQLQRIENHLKETVKS